MALSVTETFEWLRQRSEKLEEVLAENRKLRQQIVDLTLELAWHQTRRQREQEAKGEQITADILNFVVR